jgi:hypothetical protein
MIGGSAPEAVEPFSAHLDLQAYSSGLNAHSELLAVSGKLRTVLFFENPVNNLQGVLGGQAGWSRHFLM